MSSVTILSSQLTGSVDVLETHNVPQGSWISRSAGGFTFVGGATTLAGQAYGHVAGEATLTPGGRGAKADTGQHAALVGLSGERSASFAILSAELSHSTPQKGRSIAHAEADDARLSCGCSFGS